MDGAADLIDPAAAIGFELDANIKCTGGDKGSQLVEEVASVDGVHTAEHDIASGNGANRDRIEQSAGMGVNHGAETHGLDGVGGDVNFWTALFGIVLGGI